MPYTPTSWANGTTPVNATNMNNLETQYSEATQSYERFLFTPFILAGLVATKDGSIANQLDVTSGTGYLLQISDSTLRRRSPTATNFTTATPSTTYHLYLQPDGTFYWNTANSPAANSLQICTVTTDGSGNISTVTDMRPITTTLFSSMTGNSAVDLPNMVGVLTFDNTLGSNNEIMALQQGYNLYSDNVGDGSVTGSTTRLWLDAPDLGDVTIGPRNSPPVLAGVRMRALSVIMDATNGNSHTAGSLQLKGGMALSADSGNLTTDGTNGTLKKVGGQASAGSFGVPVIVAQALDVNVTSTATQTILSYAVPATGLYRINMHASIGNATSEPINMNVNYTDPHLGTPTMFFTTAQSASANANPFNVDGAAGGQLYSSSSIPTSPITVYAKAATNINVIFRDPGGTPNDYVTAIIERLA